MYFIMKRYNNLTILIILAGILFTSCGDDFLTASSTGTILSGTVLTEQSVKENLASAYHILLRDNYANGYNGVFFLADLRSDDVYKGGESAGDQGQFYNLATFTCTSSTNVEGVWMLNYRGIARCNEAIANVENLLADAGFEGNRNLIMQYKEEALFLRAYYLHVLWKDWGNIPFLTEALKEPTIAPQYTADEIYQFIMADLAACENIGLLKLKLPELGRVNLAAIYMLKAECVMYQKDASKYNEVAANMAQIIASNDYDLMSDFDGMWLESGEWCKENIFETNQGSEGTDWSSSAANPYGFGTNLPCFISPNSLTDPAGIFIGGWGFSPVRPYLWALVGTGSQNGKEPIFEAGDIRREASINNWVGGNYGDRFQDTGYYLRKYAARKGYNPKGTTDLNYANNLRIYRYAETLLNYAELVGVLGASASGGVSAQSCLDQVRARAKVNSIPVNQANIELERHREFIGEGRRYWDLIRWGKASAVLTENITETTPGGGNRPPTTWSWSRKWTDKDKYLPIPESELNSTIGTAYPLQQNQGY
jgi:hypothetical protein